MTGEEGADGNDYGWVEPEQDRILHGLRNLEMSGPYMPGLEPVHHILGLVEYALKGAGEVDARSWHSNDAAALACLARAYQGLQAASCLAVLAFYTEARATIRSVYESAGIGRMLAHDGELADKWLRKNEWVPDRQSRGFAVALAGGDEEAKVPHQQYYKNASASAHPAAVSTLPFLFDPDGSVNLKLYPAFDAAAFESLVYEITAEAIFVAYCARNSLADVDVLPPAWHQQLATLARKFTGNPMAHLDDDWDARQRQHDELQTFVRPDSEVEEFLRTHPNSLRNIRGRAREAGAGEA